MKLEEIRRLCEKWLYCEPPLDGKEALILAHKCKKLVAVAEAVSKANVQSTHDGLVLIDPKDAGMIVASLAALEDET